AVLRTTFPSSNGKDPRLSTGKWRVQLPPGTVNEQVSGECSKPIQRVAQFGSARASGARGWRFKSSHADFHTGRPAGDAGIGRCVGGGAAIAAACKAAGPLG